MTTLEDLRKANLKEQRGGETPVIAKAEPAPDKAPVQGAAPIQDKAPVQSTAPIQGKAPVDDKASAQDKAPKAESPLIADLTDHGLTIEPRQEPVPAPVVASLVTRVAPPPVVTAPVIEPAPAPPPPDPLAERIRAAVIRKRPIPSGVKATVDMSPELFYRAKRYCHDHSNATLRQLMLEVLNQFLDEEGY